MRRAIPDLATLAGPEPAAERLVETPAEVAMLDALRAASGEIDGPMERHVVRQYVIAAKLAEQRGLDLDTEVLLCASIIHDAGLYRRRSDRSIYITESGRMAREILAPFGWPQERVELCVQAVRCHHHLRRGDWADEVELVRLSDLVEVTGGKRRFGLSPTWIGELFEAVSRAGFWRMIGQAARLEAANLVRRGR